MIYLSHQTTGALGAVIPTMIVDYPLSNFPNTSYSLLGGPYEVSQRVPIQIPDNCSLDPVLQADPRYPQIIYPYTLEDYKDSMILGVDLKTNQLFNEGFQFFIAGTAYTFGLTDADKLIWMGMIVGANALTYPVAVANIDHSAFPTLNDVATVQQFYAAAMLRSQTLLSGGAILKGQIKAATTPAALDAIVDNRT